MLLKPRNWNRFQHYSKRNPPWIKLYRSILQDPQWFRLPLASKALAPMLWLLASESSEGTFDDDPAFLSHRIPMSATEIKAGLKPLISEGFLECYQDASKMLADCKQNAIPRDREQRQRERTETEEKDARAKRAVVVEIPDWINLEAWNGFLEMRHKKRADPTPKAIQLLISKLEGLRNKGFDPTAVLNASTENNWTGLYEPKENGHGRRNTAHENFALGAYLAATGK